MKKPDEFNRPRIPLSERKIKRSKIFISKKVNGDEVNILSSNSSLFAKTHYLYILVHFLIIKLPLFQTNKRKKGSIKNKPTVVKGKKPTKTA